jgi:hypothetical protein
MKHTISMEKEPFRICIRCSDMRETELIKLEFKTMKGFKEWHDQLLENINQCEYLRNDDLIFFERKAQEHFS